MESPKTHAAKPESPNAPGPNTPGSNAASPDPAQFFPLHLSHLRHRQMIGWLGFFLPVLVVIISRMWPMPDQPWRLLHSISEFYYTSANPVFVGSLFAMAMFLFTYRGYNGCRADRVLGKIASVAALVVAFFPAHITSPGISAPPWWQPWMGTVHYVATAVLFASFILFSLWLFRRRLPGVVMGPKKRRRNQVYTGCGVVMVVAIAWAVFNLLTHKPIFVPESIALAAFAISWLVKGRVYKTVTAVLQGKEPI